MEYELPVNFHAALRHLLQVLLLDRVGALTLAYTCLGALNLLHSVLGVSSTSEYGSQRALGRFENQFSAHGMAYYL